MATWWLLNRMSNDWSEFELRPALKAAGIYDPEAITLREIVTPKPAADLPELSVDEIVKLTGDAARGKEGSTRCVMCHSIAGTGADFGPALDGWGQRQVGRGDRDRDRPSRTPRSRRATTGSRSGPRTA